MECAKSYEGYVNYKCYEDIKWQFGEKIEGTSYDILDDILKFEEKYSPEKKGKLNELSDVFIKLKKYLSNTHVFALPHKYNGEGICNYISYLLYEEIRIKNRECDENTFNDFKEFVDEYNASKNSNMCKDMLKHLDSYKFQKMKTLYLLYDKYMYLSPSGQRWHADYCKDMLFLVSLYHFFLHEYRSRSSEFNDVLTQFKSLMDTITETGRSQCKGQRFFIREPDLYEPTVVQLPPPTHTSSAPESEPSQEDTLDIAHNPEPHEVPISSTTSLVEQEKLNPKSSKISQLSDPLKVTETIVSQESVETEQPHQKLEHAVEQVSFRPEEPRVTQVSFRTEGSHVSQGSYGPESSNTPGSSYGRGSSYGTESSYGPQGFIETNETFSPRKNPIVEAEKLEGHGLGEENAGFMTNVQNVISGIMKDVDPVPVVGVSGGMGALFLLFRYTPVGTFFRGGRGRAHRIPRSFNGQFPGFPDYYDYDGGYIGYAPMNINPLAE